MGTRSWLLSRARAARSRKGDVTRAETEPQVGRTPGNAGSTDTRRHGGGLPTPEIISTPAAVERGVVLAEGPPAPAYYLSPRHLPT